MNATDNMAVWRLVHRMAKTQNLTKAAQEENLELSAASRLMKEFEAQLGVSILNRQTRPVMLREEILPWLSTIEDMLKAHTSLIESLSPSAPKLPKRVFRVSIPANIPRKNLVEVVAEYSQAHPDIKIEVLGGADHMDVVEGRVEAAYLPYRPQTTDLMVISIIKGTTFMVATPEYLERNGRPKGVGDLHNHTLLLRNGDYYPVTDRLIGKESVFFFNTGIERGIADVYGCPGPAFDERRHLPITKHFAADTLSCLQAALDGVGIAVDSFVGFLEPYLRSGQLVPILTDWHRPLWDATVVTKDTLMQDPLFGSFIHQFVERERVKIEHWRTIFAQYGVDADAIVRRGF